MVRSVVFKGQQLNQGVDDQGGNGSLSPNPSPDRRQPGHPQLIAAIEQQIVPRLVAAHRQQVASGALPDPGQLRPNAEEIREFADMALAADSEPAWHYVESLRYHDIGVEDILLELFTPVARYLGERWSDDTLSFVDVTVGVCRLQEMTTELCGTLADAVMPSEVSQRHVLLVPFSGAQHNFGLQILAEFFRQAGWSPVAEADQRAIEAQLGAQHFALIGYSLSAEQDVPQLAASIAAARRHSRNATIGVMVGGPVFLDRPEWVAEVGADATAANARDAIRIAETFI